LPLNHAVTLWCSAQSVLVKSAASISAMPRAGSPGTHLLMVLVLLPAQRSLLIRHAGLAHDHSYTDAPQYGPDSAAPVPGLHPTALLPHQVQLCSTGHAGGILFQPSHVAYGSFKAQTNSFHLQRLPCETSSCNGGCCCRRYFPAPGVGLRCTGIPGNMLLRLLTSRSEKATGSQLVPGTP